ncbi:ComEC/Rec2 family competence protein [Pedobacter gandavensis]|uniref:ComEC/Rec2 family competence protein n=1 Tax=Pedobacter gandavensis TaxID=2679963 RepID=UPI0029310651|nr:ComEC/Rec2 family competence protein [Pedobacter gandavensis]
MSIPQKPPQIFLRVLLPYTLGIVAFYHFKYPGFLALLLGINLVLLLLLILINHYYQEIKAYHFKSSIGLILHFLLFFFGGLLCYHHQTDLKKDHFSKSKARYLKVQVIDEPQQKGLRLTGSVEIQAIYEADNSKPKPGKALKFKKASGKMKLTIQLDPKHPLTIKYGTLLLIPARFIAISPPFHPAIFDNRAWLATQNIHHQSFFSQHQLLKLNANAGNPILAFAINLRVKQVQRYQKLLQDKASVALASTLILGYRSDLSKALLEIYSKTGTIHALSVSGMHVGLIYLILNHTLTFLNRGKYWKILKLGLILSLLWCYTLLTGCAPAVLRAVIMLSVLLIGQTYSRPANSYNILFFAAFSMLLYDPFLIWNIGFQLSFLAVFGLLYLQPKLESCWRIENTVGRKLWALIAMSVAAQLFSSPLSLYYFHQFPLYFLLSNLFILIPITLIMYTGILLLIPGFDFLAPIVNWLIQFNNSGLQYLAALPYSSLTGIWINQLELILGSISLALGIHALAKHNWKLLLAAFSLFLPFQLSISYKSIMRYQQQQVIHFKVQKRQTIVSLFGHQATVYTHLKQGDPAFLYAIQPILDYHQIRSVKIRPLPP